MNDPGSPSSRSGPLGPSLWPATVRSADLMRGALVRCGPGVRPAGWPETPRTRLASLAPWLDGGSYFVTHRTAAWVWGAAKDPGTPLRLCVPRGSRLPAQIPPLIRFSAHSLSPEDLTVFDGLSVTTPLRTINDLLRNRSFTVTDVAACRLLLRLIPDIDVLRASLRPRRPYQRLARMRLERLTGASWAA